VTDFYSDTGFSTRRTSTDMNINAPNKPDHMSNKYVELGTERAQACTR